MKKRRRQQRRLKRHGGKRAYIRAIDMDLRCRRFEDLILFPYTTTTTTNVTHSLLSCMRAHSLLPEKHAMCSSLTRDPSCIRHVCMYQRFESVRDFLKKYICILSRVSESKNGNEKIFLTRRFCRCVRLFEG